VFKLLTIEASVEMFEIYRMSEEGVMVFFHFEEL